MLFLATSVDPKQTHAALGNVIFSQTSLIGRSRASPNWRPSYVRGVSGMGPSCAAAPSRRVVSLIIMLVDDQELRPVYAARITYARVFRDERTRTTRCTHHISHTHKPISAHCRILLIGICITFYGRRSTCVRLEFIWRVRGHLSARVDHTYQQWLRIKGCDAPR